MKKSATAIMLCILVLTLVLTVTFSAPTAVADEIKIYPDETSSYAAYGEAIAYTTAKNEIVLSAESGSFTLANAYAGKSKSIAMNGNYIFLLSVIQGESTETVSFTAYPYTLNPVSVGSGQNALNLFVGSGGNVTAEEIAGNAFYVNEKTSNGLTMGGYDYLYVSGDRIYCMAAADSDYAEGTPAADCIFFGDLDTRQWNKQGATLKNFATADDFVVVGETVYFNSENSLMKGDMTVGTQSEVLTDTLKIRSLAYADGVLYALSDDGIYAVNTADGSYKKLVDDSFDGSIRTLGGDGATYLLAQSITGKCVKQYVCGGSSFESASLEYYNIFDGVIYLDPETYDLLKVGKCTTDTDAYHSPKNRKTEFTLEEGEYVLALAKQDGYYYVRNTNGMTAYVQENDLALLEASSETAVGKYAQALHDNTNVYLYPYISDDIVATVNIDDLLIVVDNVATDGDQQVWGWYRICLVGEDASMTYGYIQSDYASKYTNFKLPSFSTDATVSAGSLGGIINVHLLPDENSEVLGTLTDGDKITLAQEKLDTSSEWTKIVYKDMVGYVRTSDLITEGMTPLQITLIVVFSVVIVATVIVVILVVKKRNAQKFDY